MFPLAPEEDSALSFLSSWLLMARAGMSFVLGMRGRVLSEMKTGVGVPVLEAGGVGSAPLGDESAVLRASSSAAHAG